MDWSYSNAGVVCENGGRGFGSLRRRSCRESCSSRKGSRSRALCSELVEIEGNVVKWRRKEVSSSEVLQVFGMLLSWSRKNRKTSFE